MELRKKVKRPQRYEPETDDAGRAERYLPPLNRPVFSVPIIEYNPDLRPAAFPTLDPAQTALSEQDHVVEPSETKSRQQADTVSIVQRPLRQLDSATSRAPDQIEARTGITPGIAVEDENRRASNCDDNPVYVRNMQLSQQWSQRTDHDWNIQEMETSDEEELQEETIAVSGTEATIVESSPAWEDLTVAHRLEIISTLAEHSSRWEAMQTLQLSLAQRREVVVQLARRHQHEIMEHENIASFHHGWMQSLLKGQASSSSILIPDVYRKLLEEHIYQSVGGEDYSLTTKKELATAKAYLNSAGFAPGLVGHWVEPSPFTSASGAPPPIDGQGLHVQSADAQQQGVSWQRQTLPVRRRYGDVDVLKGKGFHSLGGLDVGNAQPSRNDLPSASDESVQASPKKRRRLLLSGSGEEGEEGLRLAKREKRIAISGQGC
ncbi:hypothetical protein LPUS_09696 [Lasallia pustulata]|uniref:Uncharacterized protein n=1 Tax=Lasallia pustulata TaxID=136370 RepID=A0A1W5D7U6_9LECA|nr:hypothetical protein LPUS_09696 [Lasallia pustulata]